jgi:hypothetical protein
MASSGRPGFFPTNPSTKPVTKKESRERNFGRLTSNPSSLAHSSGRGVGGEGLGKTLVVALLSWVISSDLVAAQPPDFQRPSAPQLFPDSTLAYVRIDDTRELKMKYAEVSIGRMAADPQVAPILSEFYRTFNDSFLDVQKEFGIELDDILSIPNGEMALGLIPGERNPTAVFLIEAGDELPALELIVARAEEQIQTRGGFQEKLDIGRIQVIEWESESRRDRQFGYFVDAGCLVFSTNARQIESLAKIWTGNGVDHKPLADNRKFTSILTRCVGLDGERPQVSFYVDPFAIVKEVNKNNPVALAMLPILTGLGLDGLQAVGGSAIFVPKGFDSLVHAHILFDNPRRGLLEVVRPASGDTTPQAWVAEDVATYLTVNWKIGVTYRAVKEIYETFRGPDSFADEVVRKADKVLGIDFEKDIIDAVDDRVTMTQLMLRPARIGAVGQIFAFKLKNPTIMESTTLPKIFETIQANDSKWTTERFGEYRIYTRPPELKNANTPSGGRRRPEPTLAVVGDHLMFADSIKAVQAAIEATNSSEGTLRESLEYKIVRDQMKLQLGTADTSIVLYQRPEESFRLIYDLIADPTAREKMRSDERKNPFVKALLQALDSHQLPPFEVIAKYLSPAGAYITEEDNGLHYTAFGLQR